MESRTSNYLILTGFWKCLVSGECPRFLPSPRNSSTPTPCLYLSSRFHPGLPDHSTVTTYTINHTAETSSTLEPCHAAESSPVNKKSKLSPEPLNYSLNTVRSLGTKVCLIPGLSAMVFVRFQRHLFYVYVCACLMAVCTPGVRRSLKRPELAQDQQELQMALGHHMVAGSSPWILCESRM